MADEAVLFHEQQVKPSQPPAAAKLQTTQKAQHVSVLPIIAIDLPVLYEDEGQEEMGEHTIHTLTDDIIRLGLESHLAGRPTYHIFSNLNLYYHRIDPKAYVSPDEMVVVAELPPNPSMGSYHVGETGPAPVLVVEVLSRRTYQQQDLSPTGKPVIYAELGVAEYILVDVTGAFLPQRLLLKRLNEAIRDEDDLPTWQDEQDTDGGVTSQLGFRLLLEADGQVRMLDALSGRRYLRPEEVETTRQALEEELARLKAELARLRRSPDTDLGL